jgi:methylenetetrahydrofolate--tRNA-(uracil-5-)-methyltransferase
VNRDSPVIVVGGGFAGVEAAWAIAERGGFVTLYEMRPVETSPAHTTEYLAELVCSNSFKSKLPTSPAGRLKIEMEALGSLVLQVALRNEVPAGEALGVDRNKFGLEITSVVESHPRIQLKRTPVSPEQIEGWLSAGRLVILATGPLTLPSVAAWLAEQTGRDHLYFYDAVSPTVDASTIDHSKVFAQSRYDKGSGADYLNCPFSKDEYYTFVRELVGAKRAPVHAFEAGGNREAASDEGDEAEFLKRVKYFAGCTPIEAIAEKGERSLAFGNFKPVGLIDPKEGRRPYAALQLRPENSELTLYSLVACQTRLRWGEQKRVFGMVPGLETAEFVRYGVIHRNTYIDAPRVLHADLETKSRPNLFLAGQLTGVEGYVESAASGIYAGLVAMRRLQGKTTPAPNRASAYGSLSAHLLETTDREFAPMNINWGLFPALEDPPKNKELKRSMILERAQVDFEIWREVLEL